MVHDFWMYRSDPEFVREQLPVVRSILDWFLHHQNENGLLGSLSWWAFVDWSDDFPNGVPPQTANGNSAIHSLQFLEALRYGPKWNQAWVTEFKQLRTIRKPRVLPERCVTFVGTEK